MGKLSSPPQPAAALPSINYNFTARAYSRYGWSSLSLQIRILSNQVQPYKDIKNIKFKFFLVGIFFFLGAIHTLLYLVN